MFSHCGAFLLGLNFSGVSSFLEFNAAESSEATGALPICGFFTNLSETVQEIHRFLERGDTVASTESSGGGRAWRNL